MADKAKNDTEKHTLLTACHAEACPVCHGQGLVHPWMPSTSTSMVECHVCKGGGWITVPNFIAALKEPTRG